MTAAPNVQPPLDPGRWETLSFAQRFAVWSLRLWLARQLGDETAEDRAHTAFAVAGAPEAAIPLDRLMRSVSTLAARPIQFAPVCAAALSGDEALLLRALAVGQAGDVVDGAMILRAMFGRDGCRVVRHLCVEYARALAEVGLLLGDTPKPCPATPRHAPFGSAAARR